MLTRFSEKDFQNLKYKTSKGSYCLHFAANRRSLTLIVLSNNRIENQQLCSLVLRKEFKKI